MSTSVTPQNYRSFSGYRACRYARSTGAIVSVIDGEAQHFDTFAGRWYTLCETHGAAIAHESMRLALGHAAQPEQWCDECAAIHAGERGTV